jgi:eukaryotic-like serine/threonine-protein kinase
VPDAGRTVPINSEVVVQISRDNLVEVPSVVGRSEDSARERLEDLGFKVEVRQGPENDDAGIVVQQSPRGGNTAKKGETITITVTVARPDPAPSSPSPSPTASPPSSPSPTAGGAGGGLPSATSPPPLLSLG